MVLDAASIDETLVARAAAGEEAAFARIVSAYHEDLCRVGFLICGDLDLTDEAVQRAWVLAWRKLGDLRDRGRVRHWLVAVAANEARQVLRRRGRRSIVEIEAAELSLEPIADPAGRADDLDLANALARLHPDDRQLLALRFVAGFDSFEIARMRGGSASGIRARVARLLQRLRTELGDD